MFASFWPVIQEHIPDRDERIDFTADVLKLLVRGDMDPWDVEDVDSDVRAALVHAGIGISEPERYEDTSEPIDDATDEELPAATIDRLRSLGPDFPVFSLQPLIASTKRRASHERSRLIALILVHFLQDHELTTRTILPPNNTISDDFVLRVGDFTDEGLALYCSAEQQWLRRIDHGMSPTDTTLLVKALRTERQS